MVPLEPPLTYTRTPAKGALLSESATLPEMVTFPWAIALLIAARDMASVIKRRRNFRNGELFLLFFILIMLYLRVDAGRPAVAKSTMLR